MTNAEKFKEVFSFEPDYSVAPVPCKACCKDCKYYTLNEKIHCRSCEWWDEEFTNERGD